MIVQKETYVFVDLAKYASRSVSSFYFRKELHMKFLSFPKRTIAILLKLFYLKARKMKPKKDMRCGPCFGAISDLDGHFVLYSKDIPLRRGHKPMAMVVHRNCDKLHLRGFPSWEHVRTIIDDPTEIRAHLSVLIQNGQMPHEAAKIGLEQIFDKLPADFFDYREEYEE